jgi:ABC-2 type transport system ATP-binding protein
LLRHRRALSFRGGIVLIFCTIVETNGRLSLQSYGQQNISQKHFFNCSILLSLPGMDQQDKAVVDVRAVCKSYGSLKAVDRVTFSVSRGEIFGLLGPNGAGKTTTLEMLEGLRTPDSGEIFINSLNALKNMQAIKEIIGVQLQATSLYNKIKVHEALRLFGSYYKQRRPVSELLSLVSLSDKQDCYHKELSGGQMQRLALALALINDPVLVFLDEPTTGLDPQARRNLWDIIATMKQENKTVLLTTHYMDEAEKLCDHIAIMDHGRILSLGSPGELISGLNTDSCLEFVGERTINLLELQSEFPGQKVLTKGNIVELFTKTPQKCVIKLLNWAQKKNIIIKDLHIRRATLEDVFLELTGRSLRE